MKVAIDSFFFNLETVKLVDISNISRILAIYNKVECLEYTG